MIQRVATLFFIFLLFSFSSGFTPSPPRVSHEIRVPATLKKDPVQKINVGKFAAEFEKTTLDEIRSVLGAGTIEHAGEAGESQYWLCYSLPGQRIWFISHGEMGGEEHVLTQVHVISTGKILDSDATIPQIPMRFQPVTFDFGWIGEDKESIIKKLGQPSGIQNNYLIYFYVKELKRPLEGCSIMGCVELGIKNNKINSIIASHISSC
jgi:hypothetical protein